MKLKTDIKAGQGLGDAVESLAQWTGMDRLASYYEDLTGKDCGCQARKETLNQWFQFPKIV